MSKESMDKFLKKSAATPALAGKIDALQEEYKEKLAGLAEEAGFQITPEDFGEEMKPLNDDEAGNVSGGWNPHGPIFP